MTENTHQLIVFARAPIVGQCKSRLIPLLNPQGSSDFYKKLLSHCFNQLENLDGIDISLYVYPDADNHYLKKLAEINSVTLVEQQGKNLGERMFNAIHDSLQHYNKTVLIGTDCPLLDASYIKKAFSEIRPGRLVLGPATDGGYVLIGANHIEPCFFENINWGTEHVLEQSIMNIVDANYEYSLLDVLWDIDTPDDFINYKQTLQALSIID